MHGVIHTHRKCVDHVGSWERRCLNHFNCSVEVFHQRFVLSSHFAAICDVHHKLDCRTMVSNMREHTTRGERPFTIGVVSRNLCQIPRDFAIIDVLSSAVEGAARERLQLDISGEILCGVVVTHRRKKGILCFCPIPS